MPAGANGEQIERGGFAVLAPAQIDESGAGPDPVRQQKAIAGQHPVKLDALEDLSGEILNLAIRREISCRGQDTA
jgi:hypothetical protein